mmetsp:Transcript_55647/g.143369  ORF Transcript_55647/g.143369 Transcript_55647/m.143369 type:complete len:272 (+) Transcript_55647:53-868(+)
MERRRKPSPRKSPEEVIESFETKRKFFEHQHLQSCGRQITSGRETNPAVSFGFRATQERNNGRTTWEESKIWNILDPRAALPGPTNYTHTLPEVPPTNLVRGFGVGERFPGDGPDAAKAATGRSSSDFVDTSTSTQLLEAGEANSTVAGGTQPTEPVEAEPPVPLGKVDPNHDLDLRLKYVKKPAYSFGTATLGTRIPDWAYSREMAAKHQPVVKGVKTTRRLATFRELRESIPQPKSSDPRFFPQSARGASKDTTSMAEGSQTLSTSEPA